MRSVVLWLASCFAISACGGSDGDGSPGGTAATASNMVQESTGTAGVSASVASSAAADAATGHQSVTGQISYSSSTPITLQGLPPSSATVGVLYSFKPTVLANAGSVEFSIKGQPQWMNFNSSTGALTGLPGKNNVGLTPNITITATTANGAASVGPFAILVDAAQATASTSDPAPVISGIPANSVVAGNTYKFVPTASDPRGNSLTFNIQNQPSWASYNNVTGELSGTPTSAEVGTYANIVVSVSDGSSTVQLAPFAIAVTQTAINSATLKWTPPTQGASGSLLTNLAGFLISYGTSASSLTQVIQVSDAAADSYVLTNLSPGKWFFTISAYTSAGVTGSASAATSVTIYN